MSSPEITARPGASARILAFVSTFLLVLLGAAGSASAGAPLSFKGFDGAATRDAAGNVATQAASHPFADGATVEFGTTRNPSTGTLETDNNPKDLIVELPAGVVGNPLATPRCPYAQFAIEEGIYCPDNTAVGLLTLKVINGRSEQTETAAIYNLEPPPGTPALFGVVVITVPVYFTASVRTGGDYGLNLDFRELNQGLGLEAANVTFWGDPFDSAHDEDRGRCAEPFFTNGPCRVLDFERSRKPFVTLPTSCEGPTTTTATANSWQEPAVLRRLGFLSHDAFGAPVSIEGCEQVSFDAAVATAAEASSADSPSGLTFDLTIPQNENTRGLSTSHLRTTTVALPAGMTVNAAAANGLTGCSAAQEDLHGPGAPACPDASRIGSVSIETPVVDHPLPGIVNLATPGDNPSSSLLAVYLNVVDPQTGVVLKLPGKIDADPTSGQLSATFADTPQLPFEHLSLRLDGGANAVLKTPATCGSPGAQTTLSPWSGNPAIVRASSISVTQGAGGGPCPAGGPPSSWSFEAGTKAPLAGTYSPFLLRLSRPDGSQNLRAIDATLPVGLLARLAGTPYCPDAALAAAAGKSGAAERSAPACPAASRIGSVTAGAGAGPSPFYTSGSVYLAGPYKGAPLSLAIDVPAVAGPFDLGTVVVRTALQVDPVTAQVRAVSDPIPTILQGIPLDLRSVAVDLDKPSFTVNPTSCDPTAVTGAATSDQGASTPLSSRFQVGGCDGLGFAPALSLKLKGATRRGAYPQLTATLTPRKGDANIARAAVTLPRSEFLAQGHIKTVCTRVQYAADNCPKASIYGYAVAETPLLDKPLRGPVYLRSSSDKLPNLVASLRGQISIDLAGRIDSVKGGGIRTVFAAVPDAPVSKFTLRLAGGKRGLLVNSQDLCSGKKKRAVAKLAGHDGDTVARKPVVVARCR